MNVRVLAFLSAGAVLAAVVGAVPAVAAPAVAATSVTGGHTLVQLKAVTMRAIHGKGFALKPIAPATLAKGVLRLPTTGGTAKPPTYITKEAGGFSVSRNGKKVSVTHLVLNTKTERATADVTNHGRIVVFVLGQPNAGSGGPGWVEFGGYSVKLSYRLTHALYRRYGTQVFINHPLLGTGTSKVVSG